MTLRYRRGGSPVEERRPLANLITAVPADVNRRWASARVEELSLAGLGLETAVDLSVRAGYGLEGVLGDAGDGLIFLSVGYRGDLPSTNQFTTNAAAEQGGTLAAAIPARSGF